MSWPPRIVETGHGIDGRPAFLSDASAPVAIQIGPATVIPLLRFGGGPRRIDAGRVTGPPQGTLEPGGLSVQLMRLERTGDGWPESGGWRQVPTQDLTTVVGGRLVVGLEDGDHHLVPVETLVLRGDVHRFRAPDGAAITLGAHLLPDPDAQPTRLAPRSGSPDESFGRRLVTDTIDGRSVGAMTTTPWVLRPAGGRVAMADVWQTGGSLPDARQGGDADGPWQRDPLNGGALAGLVRLEPGDYSDAANWHTTATVDVDVIVEGSVELWLPDLEPVQLHPGDVVVQRGVEHRWQPVGDHALVMATLMIGASGFTT